MNGGVDGVVKRWRSAVLTVGGIVLLGCLSAKDLAHERKLQALVQRGATRAEVVFQLGFCGTVPALLSRSGVMV